MTLDSLEVALRAVPQKCPSCDFVFSAKMVLHVCPFPDLAPDYPALVAGAREWMRQHLPGSITAECAKDIDGYNGYNAALADVARWLGLEEPR